MPANTTPDDSVKELAFRKSGAPQAADAAARPRPAKEKR
jgi:hypothetical protein